jgi:hypothetical protein
MASRRMGEWQVAGGEYVIGESQVDAHSQTRTLADSHTRRLADSHTRRLAHSQTRILAYSHTRRDRRSPLAYSLLLAAVVEFLALRLLIRMGPMLPEAARGDGAAAVTQGLIVLGTVAQNFGLLLALGLLLLLACRTSQSSLRLSLAAAVVLAVAHLLAGPAAPPWLYAAFLLAVVTVMAAALWAVDCPCRRPAWLALFGATYLLVLYPTLSGTLALQLPLVPLAHTLAETGAVLAACLALPALRPRFEWRALLPAMVAAGLLAGMWFSVSWLPPTLMIWTVAFTGFLPAPVYIVALGLFVYTLCASILNAGGRTAVPAVVPGLALIALGGLRWDFSYYVLLGLLGLLLLAGVHQSKISGD